MRLLFEAALQAALMRDSSGHTPVTLTVCNLRLEPTSYSGKMAVARYMLKGAAIEGQHTSRLLAALRQAHNWALPLYPVLVARRPLTVAQWAAVPPPCLGLGAALPAVLQRSEAEAAQLVRHLPTADQRRLRTLALCLGAAAWRGLVPPLPTPIVHQLLAECAGSA